MLESLFTKVIILSHLNLFIGRIDLLEFTSQKIVLVPSSSDFFKQVGLMRILSHACRRFETELFTVDLSRKSWVRVSNYFNFFINMCFINILIFKYVNSYPKSVELKIKQFYCSRNLSGPTLVPKMVLMFIL